MVAEEIVREQISGCIHGKVCERACPIVSVGRYRRIEAMTAEGMEDG